MSAPPEQAPQFSLGDLLEAIEGTAADLAAMTEKVATLEAANFRLEEEGNDLNAQLTDMEIRVEAANAALQATTLRADQAETGAAVHSDRAERIEADIAEARDDIARITAAVSDLVAQRQARRAQQKF